MNSNNLTDNAAKQRVKASIPTGRFDYMDLWGESLTVSGQKYVMRVVLKTEPIEINQQREDSYTFFNYKWTAWIYWGDYLSHTTSHITTITISELNAFQISQGIAAYSLRTTYENNDDYNVTKSLHSFINESLKELPTYFLYYDVDNSNGRGCTLKATYGTDFTASWNRIYN